MDVPTLLDALAKREPYHNEYLRAWVIADPDHIQLLARSSCISAARKKSFVNRLPKQLRDRVPHLLEIREQLLLFRDGDSHRRLRAKTAALLTSRLTLIRKDVDSLWEAAWQEAATSSMFDAVDAVLVPAVSKTIRLLLNCPPDVAASLRHWSESFNRSMSGDSDAAEFERAEASLKELWTMVRGYETEASDGTWIEGLFSSCREPFDWSERRQTLLLLILAGFDTSISMLSNCLVLLIHRQANGTETFPGYDNESAVQMTCPVKFTMREVVTPLQFEGHQFKTGDRVLFSWHGGNKHLADAGALAAGGFAFGVGPHSCLGKAIALHQLRACFHGLERIGRQLVLDMPVDYNGNLCFNYPITIPAKWS